MIYVINDMANAFFTPTKTKAYNVQFGISLVFGQPKHYHDRLPTSDEKILPVLETPNENPMEENKDGDTNDDGGLNLSFINSL